MQSFGRARPRIATQLDDAYAVFRLDSDPLVAAEIVLLADLLMRLLD